jgi:hypothetical protein
MRHPIVVAFDEKRLREQLQKRARIASITSLVLPFDVTGRVLVVSQADYRRVRPNAEAILRIVELKVRTLRTDRERMQRWNEVLRREAQHYRTEEWRVLLFRWAPSAPPETFTTRGQDLATGFVQHALGIDNNNAMRAIAADLRGKCAPDDSKERLIEAAFELQNEKDQDALVRYFAPRVVLFAASLFPVSQVPIVIGAAITAITGFIEFMQFIEDAEADGDISEEEANEAPWSLLGILPFKLVQNALTIRSIGLLAINLLGQLIEAVASLPALIDRHLVARDNGWGGYGEYDSETSLFVPRHVVGG